MADLGELIVRIGADNKDLRAKLAQVQTQINTFSGKTQQQVGGLQKSFSGLEKGINSVGGALVGALSVGAAISVGQKIIQTTAEFQKLEAVLSNTLGSQEAATQAFAQIKTFAAQTNFSVLELSDSFVKLSNQGMSPSLEDMRRMADVANSTGKSFDQLTEAVIDAATGEFERLKEFGIRASKQGDKVTFTFKGQQKQVDFTNDAIRDYVLSLGDLDGVSGSTEKISKTLGGQISNLGDAFDNLFATIGGGSTGVLSELIGGLSNLISTFTTMLDSTQSVENRLKSFVNLLISAFNTFLETVLPMKGIIEKALGVDLAIPKFELDEVKTSTEALDEAVKKITSSTDKQKGSTKKLTKAEKEKLEVYKQMQSELANVDKIQSKVYDGKSLNTIAGINNQIGLLNKKLENTEIGTEAFRKLTEQIANLSRELDNAKDKAGGFGMEMRKGVSDFPPMLTDEWAEKQNDRAAKVAAIINSTMSDVLMLGAETLTAALGTAFAGGDIMELGHQMVMGFANLLSSLGKQLIALGVAQKATLESLSLGPAGFAIALAAGAAALIAAAAIKSTMSNGAAAFANGGLVFGPTLGLVGEGRGTSPSNPEVIAPLDKLKSFMPSQGGGMGDVNFRIQGKELVGIINRYNNTNKYNT